MSEIDDLMQRGADAYAAGDFAAAQAAWQAAADAGHDGAQDALRLVAHGDARRQVLWGKLAERENANALWSLGVAAVERADLPGVREHWSQAATLDEALAGELAGLLDCDPAVAAASILARERFVQWLSKAGQDVGIELPKGVSESVKKSARCLFNQQGVAGLSAVSKWHFKTTQEVVEDN